LSELLGTVTVLLEYAAEVTELVIHDLYGHSAVRERVFGDVDVEVTEL
jgi:hypothetical protein